MSDVIKRVPLASPAGHIAQVAEDQVEKFLDGGWTKVTGRRADTSGQAQPGATPAQGR